MAQPFQSEIHEDQANTQMLLVLTICVIYLQFKAYEELKKNEYKENSTLLPLAVTSHQMAKLLFCIFYYNYILSK